MEWVLIGFIIILGTLVNIRSFIFMSQLKQQRAEMIEDTDSIHQSMEEFVTKLEKENDELYRELVNYIKMKESKLDERIRILEENQVTKVMRESIVEQIPDKQEYEKPTEAVVIPDVIDKGNERISQMHKQGFSPKQIAKILQIDHGEVELIVNMLKIKSSYHK